jgi:5-methyltetrahydropteroyltriglutamate--homocysteine methyltransferase
MLPTSIIGSLPRPGWYTAELGAQSFLEAMMNLRYREQYEDAVSVYLGAQEIAGLDIVTDGDAHFDEQISGMSWHSYPLTHMAGFSRSAEPSAYQIATGAPQRMTRKPVKFGAILPELLTASVADEYYKDPVERSWALSDALNSELAGAGCPVIQMEEPQIHMVPARGKPFGNSMSTISSNCSTTRSRDCAARPRSGAIPVGAIRRSNASSGTSRAISRHSPHSVRSMPMR